MARGEDNVESCVDESSSSTLFEDVPSRVGMNGVIMWLRPTEEARTYAFWKKFSSLPPPMSRFLFPPRGLNLWAIRTRIEVA